MSSNEGLIRRRSFLRLSLLTEKALVAIILLLFLLLHGLACAILQRASVADSARSEPPAALRLYD